MFASHSPLVLALFIFLGKHSIARSYAVPEKVYYDLELSEDLFKNFISQYEKQYTAEEAEYRFQVFQENLKRINELNQEHESAVFGLTPFSDMTSEELRATMSCVYNVSDVQPAKIPDINAPSTLDYRQEGLVTEVKNQGQCGSCYIFGMIGDIEGQYAKNHKKLISLAEQYPLDCGPFTCGGGRPDDVANWLSQTSGAVSSQDYPYQGSKGQCRNPSSGIVQVQGAQVNSVRSTEELKQLLAQHGPLATVLFAPDSFSSYKGGIVNPSDCPGGNNSNHVVTLVGYGDGYWLIKNSWSTSWGENGYLRLAFENNCAFGSFIFPSQVN